MRKKIIYIEFLIMTFITLLLIIEVFIGIQIGNHKFWAFIFVSGILLSYYSTIKSIFGIILFMKNIFQKNITIASKRLLLLFIPSLILIIPMGYFLIGRLLNGWDIGWEMMVESIILIIGNITLLNYLILNKTLIFKFYYKIILAIILPISYSVGYWTVWAIMLG